MSIVKTDSMFSVMDYYGKHSSEVSRICFSNSIAECPSGFTVVNVVARFAFHV